MLLAVPIYIDQIRIETRINDPISAQVELMVSLASKDAYPDPENLSMNLLLLTPAGDTAAAMEVNYFEPIGQHLVGNAILPVHQPQPWSAENPRLYTLQVDLLREGKVIHRIRQDVGIRQLEVLKNSIHLNDISIQLRGIEYTGYHPRTGLALTLEQIQKDLTILKQAHADTVHTVLPPSKDFLKECDRQGVYVICQLPLRDDITPNSLSSFINQYTNHPSIIAWAIDSSTDTHDQDLIRNLSLQKPVIWISSTLETIPYSAQIAGYSGTGSGNITLPDKPVIFFKQPLYSIERLWRSILEEGQGTGLILQGFAQLYEPPDEPPNHMQDDLLHGLSTPGMVDPDRTPLPGFWQVRQVYSPIQIREETERIRRGRQVIELDLSNHYYLTNLNQITCTWSLYQDKQLVNEGDLALELGAGQKMEIAFPFELTEEQLLYIHLLRIAYSDQTGNSIYERTIWLRPDDWKRQLVMRLQDLNYDPGWQVTIDARQARVDHQLFRF